MDCIERLPLGVADPLTVRVKQTRLPSLPACAAPA